MVRALTTVDFGTRTRLVRINGLDTMYAYRDIIEVVLSDLARLVTPTGRVIISVPIDVPALLPIVPPGLPTADTWPVTRLDAGLAGHVARTGTALNVASTTIKGTVSSAACQSFNCQS